MGQQAVDKAPTCGKMDRDDWFVREYCNKQMGYGIEGGHSRGGPHVSRKMCVEGLVLVMVLMGVVRVPPH